MSTNTKMQLPRMTQFHAHTIWSRRFHDNRVLLLAFKVGDHNKITFTKDPTMGTNPYYISGKNVRKYKKESNGKLMCFSVDADALQPLELINDIRSII